MKTMRAAFASILSFAILVASPGLEGARLAAEVVRAQAPRGTAGFQAPGVAALGSVGANLLPSAALSPAGLDAAALSPALTVDGLAAPALSASEAVPAAQAQAAPVAPVSGFETSSSRAPAAPNARPTAGLPGVVAEPSLAHSAALAASEARTPAASPTAIGGLRAIGAKIARGVSEPALNAFFENGRALAAQESALVPAAGPRSLQVKESHADTLSNSGLQPAAAAPGAAAPVAAAPRAGAWGASLFAPLVASIPAISLFLAHPAASFAVGAAAGAASGFIARLRLAKPVKILALAAVGVAAAWFAPSWLVPAGIAAGFLGVRALMPARREKAAAPTLSAETQAANLAALKADIDARVAATPGPRAQAAKRERIAVVAAGRLPQGKFPSSMQRKESTKSLGAKLLAGLLASAGLAANQVEQLYRGGTPVKIFWGSVDSSESPNIAREIAVEAGLASIPGSGIAKNCGTSLEAVAMGLNALWAGEEEVVIAGGVEVMSRFPQFTKDPVLQQQVLTLMVLPSMIRKAPWWQKIIMRATQAWTWLSFKWRLSRLQHRFAISEGLTIDSVQMAQTAQTLADKYGFDRDAQDWFAWRSQTQAAAATARGDFDDEMVSYVDYKGKDIRHDQGIRFGKTSRSGFRKLEPVFGTREITAGNASQISDGASGVILMTESKARELGYVPMAYITAVSDTGVDPNQMGIGPAYSIPMALKKAGVELKDVQAVELNEAFAGQSGAVVKTLELGGLKSPALVNARGGAIALGHALASSGTRILATLIHYMMHNGLVNGVCSLCIGGGEGIAAVVSRDPNGIDPAFVKTITKGLESRGVSPAVVAKVVSTINGLPPVLRDGPNGPETYSAVWDFLAQLGEITAMGGGGPEAFVQAVTGKPHPGVHIHRLDAVRVFGERLEAVLDSVRRDVDAFGAPKTGYKNFKVSVAQNGVATVVISRPEKLNALNLEVGTELEAIIDRLAADHDVRAVVFTGEGKAFVAGADINVISGIPSAEEGERLSAQMQAMFGKIEDFPKPWINALNGTTLGGGLELAMAGHVRIASGQAEMGLPEMTLGILPGAGGTQRVTRLVGLTEGLTMMNSSETRDAYTALQRGLVDRVVAPAKLLAEAQKEAEFLADLEGRDLQKFLKEHRTLQRKITPTLMEQVGLNAGYHTAVIGLAAGAAIGFGVFAWLTSFAWAIPLGIVGAALVAAASLWVVPGNARLFYSNIDGAIDKSGHPEYRHNIHQIVDAALYGYRNGPKAGLAREARNFGEVATRPLAKFMTLLALRKFGGAKMDMVFDMARQAGVENPEQYAKPRKLEKIGIAGPGTMGAGTGYVAAYNGLPVVLKGINAADVANGFKRVQADFDERVSGDKMDPREAAKKMALVTGTFDDAEFAKSGATIVSDNILVPGKSYEWNEKYKEGLYAKWGKAFPEGTIFVANTSASLVTPMAKATGRPGRVLGLHLFNPPKALPLAELILPDTKDFTPKDWRDLLESVATVLDFCKKTGRLVVVMNDREAFVVNRALLPYIDQANHLIAEGAPIEQIDRVMKGLGLPMGPLELADHIGFILGVEIGEYLPGKYDYMKDTSPILAGLYSMGLMGKFWGDKGGYYTYKKEKDRKTKKEELKPDHPKNELMVEAEAAGRAWERSVQKLRQWSKLQADKDANKPVQDADLAAADAEARAAVRAHAEALLSELGDPEGSAPENAGLANIRAVRDDGSQHMIAGEVERTLLAAEARIVRSTRPAQRKISDREIEQRLRYLMINEGARMLAEGVVDSPAEVDIAMTAGMGWPTSSGGLMRTADQDGVANVVAALRRYAQRYGPIFEPSPWLVERAEQGRRIYE